MLVYECLNAVFAEFCKHLVNGVEDFRFAFSDANSVGVDSRLVVFALSAFVIKGSASQIAFAFNQFLPLYCTGRYNRLL